MNGHDQAIVSVPTLSSQVEGTSSVATIQTIKYNMTSSMRALMVASAITLVFITFTSAQKSHYQKKIYSYKSLPHSSHGKLAKVESFSKKGFLPLNVPTYEYGYKIHDPQHNNYQEKTESRLGDTVKGFYTVLQPHGVIQLVRYESVGSGHHSKLTHHK